MAEASDTLINSQNQRISTLERELAETRHEAKTKKLANRKLQEQLAAVTKERDEHAATIATATKERDDLKTKLTAAPDEKDQKISDLELKLRTRSHQDKFNELAKKAGCDETALAAAWTLSGYTPEADEPDIDALTEAIAAAQLELPIAFKPAQVKGQESGAVASKKAALLPGVGSQRGTSAKTALNGVFRVKRSELRDLEFMKRNQEKFAEASKAGTLELVDG